MSDYETFVIVGIGRFGRAIAEQLSKYNKELMIIDRDEEIINDMADVVRKAIIGDATNEKFLKSMGVSGFDVGIVSVGEDITASILITMGLKNCGVKYVIAKATSDIHKKILARVGADRIVFPEKEAGKQLAEALSSSSIMEYISLSQTYGIVEIKSPDSFEGKDLRDLNLRAKYGVHVIGIKRKIPVTTESGRIIPKEEIIVAPDPSEKIIQGDILIVLGYLKDIEKLRGLK